MLSQSHRSKPVCKSKLFMGIDVCDLTQDEALELCQRALFDDCHTTFISFLNAHNANIMISDNKYRSILADHIVFPDGVGVDIASVLLHGEKFAANLNGTDFIPALFKFLSQPQRIGLLGATPEVVHKARKNFQERFDQHNFLVISNGFFDDVDSLKLANEIKAQKLDILLVAMGTPKQEKWISDHLGRQHAKLVFGVGALFDFVAEEVKRAPRLWRRARLEWLYRLLQEPGRLWRRYIFGNPLFLFRALAWRLGLLRL